MAETRLTEDRPGVSYGEGGRPSLDTGEPVLHRWFVILMLVLVPLGIAVTVWAFLATGDVETLTPAERRPPGTAEVTHDRGEAALNETREVAAGPSCAEGVEVVGDQGAIATGVNALGAVCTLLRNGEFPEVEAGLKQWIASDGVLRVAVFERTGVDSSARVEDGRIVIELNAKYQFEDGTRAAPVILHELVHLGQDWPGAPITAEQELEAMLVQARACDTLVFPESRPRACLDAEELLELEDVVQELRDAGYPR